jgi:hypothetical protein
MTNAMSLIKKTDNKALLPIWLMACDIIIIICVFTKAHQHPQCKHSCLQPAHVPIFLEVEHATDNAEECPANLESGHNDHGWEHVEALRWQKNIIAMKCCHTESRHQPCRMSALATQDINNSNPHGHATQHSRLVKQQLSELSGGGRISHGNSGVLLRRLL